jgi:V-type H+-transporting ATPase subunit F
VRGLVAVDLCLPPRGIVCVYSLFHRFYNILAPFHSKSSPFVNFILQDTVSGFLLAGVGHRTADSTNFLIVKTDTKIQQVEEAFLNFSQRDDVGIILINQHIAGDIRHVLKDYTQTIPTVLEIPSKEHPYDPEQDYIMQRVNMYLGAGT